MLTQKRLKVNIFLKRLHFLYIFTPLRLKCKKREGKISMLKGCQKSVIFVKGKENELFEEAYFVMKDTERAHSTADIIAEARRIIETEDMSASPVSVKLNRKKKLICFCIGALVTCLLWAGAMIFNLFM